MTDLDPEIWNTPNLGEAAQVEFLDERTAQDVENRAARIEGREPMEVRRIHRYPGSHGEIPLANSYDDGLRRYDPNTGELGAGEYGQVSPDGEPENPGYEKDEEGANGEESDEFSGTETESGGSDGTVEPVPETTDDGYQA